MQIAANVGLGVMVCQCDGVSAGGDSKYWTGRNFDTQLCHEELSDMKSGDKIHNLVCFLLSLWQSGVIHTLESHSLTYPIA